MSYHPEPDIEEPEIIDETPPVVNVLENFTIAPQVLELFVQKHPQMRFRQLQPKVQKV